jgi:hypothetical protein
MTLRSLIFLAPFIVTTPGNAQDTPSWAWRASGHYARAFGEGGVGFSIGLARRITAQWRIGVPFSYSSISMGPFSGHRQLIALGSELLYSPGGSEHLSGLVGLGASVLHSNVPLYSYPISPGAPAQDRIQDGTGVGISVRSGLGLPLSKRLRPTLAVGVTFHTLYADPNPPI